MSTNPEILGVDVGGVILDFMPHFDTDLSFRGENYLQTPELEGAIDSIARLNKGRFLNRVHLVSRFDPVHGGPSRTLEWLHNKKFFERTGIPEENFHPCAERQEKVPICIELGITHFIDDRAEVLGHMIGTVEHLYLFKSSDAHQEEFAHLIPQFQSVDSWKELLILLEH